MMMHHFLFYSGNILILILEIDLFCHAIPRNVLVIVKLHLTPIDHSLKNSQLTIFLKAFIYIAITRMKCIINKYIMRLCEITFSTFGGMIITTTNVYYRYHSPNNQVGNSQPTKESTYYMDRHVAW